MVTAPKQVERSAVDTGGRTVQNSGERASWCFRRERGMELFRGEVRKTGIGEAM